MVSLLTSSASVGRSKTNANQKACKLECFDRILNPLGMEVDWGLTSCDQECCTIPRHKL